MYPTPSIELDDYEIYYLLGLHGPCIIWGVRNPFLGLNSNRIEKALEAAKHSLVDKGVIQVEGNVISMHQIVGTICTGLTNPMHTLIATIQHASKYAKTLYVHISPDIYVEHLPFETHRHRFTAVFTRDMMLERLKNHLGLIEGKAARGCFSLPRRNLFKARDLAQKGKVKHAHKLLIESGITDAQAKVLLTTLREPIGSASVVVLVNRNNLNARHVNGLGILQGKNGTWALRLARVQGEESVEFTSSNTDEINLRLADLLP